MKQLLYRNNLYRDYVEGGWMQQCKVIWSLSSRPSSAVLSAGRLSRLTITAGPMRPIMSLNWISWSHQMLLFLPFCMNTLTVPLNQCIQFFGLTSYLFKRCLAAFVVKAHPTPLGIPFPASWEFLLERFTCRTIFHRLPLDRLLFSLPGQRA